TIFIITNVMFFYILRFVVLLFFFFFFFQAEDGIRDKLVTGVQTCALPISSPSLKSRIRKMIKSKIRSTIRRPLPFWSYSYSSSRSEERRVGKECRSRWSLYD